MQSIIARECHTNGLVAYTDEHILHAQANATHVYINNLDYDDIFVIWSPQCFSIETHTYIVYYEIVMFSKHWDKNNIGELNIATYFSTLKYIHTVESCVYSIGRLDPPVFNNIVRSQIWTNDAWKLKSGRWETESHSLCNVIGSAPSKAIWRKIGPAL